MNNLPAEKNRRILIIDDNRAIHDDFRKILSPPTSAATALDVSETELFGKPTNVVQKIRYEIDSAYQGQEGVLLVEKALAEGRPYAMAFVDVRMPPGMDGVDTTRKIWAIDPEVQIVLCTAYSDYSWDEMFEKIGNSDGLVILKKPFDTVEAMQLAQAFTEKWWLHKQSRQKMGELESMVAARTGELQQSNQTLQRRQTELRVLFDLMPAMIWFKDTENNIVRVNQRVAETAGKTIEEIEGRPSIEIYPQEAARFYADDLEVIHSNVPKLGFIETLPDQEGKERWVQTDKVPVCDKDGKVTGIVVMAQDITERKRAEVAVQESEFRYRSLFENMVEGYAHCRMVFKEGQREDFIILEVNSAFGTLTGLENVTGKKASEVMPGIQETNPEIFEIYSRVALTGKPEKYELHLKALAKWFSVQVYSSEKDHFIAVFDDITERKLAENLLRESEERFSGAFEFAPIGMALVAPDGRWLKVNRALCELVGYSEAELLARTFQDITHPDDLVPDLEYVRKMLAGEIGSYQIEKRYVHKRGYFVTILLNVSLVRDDHGQPLYFISQIQDITERKRNEESLRLLGSAVEQSKESIVITDAGIDLPGPKIIFVNPAFTQMTGYTAAEVLGKTPRILQGPRTDKNVLSRLRKNLEHGEAFAGEAINYRKDGNEFDMEWQIAPLRNASRIITHFVAIQHDITGRKKLEAQLFQSQKLETVGKLAGGIAHEFNSILTAIIGQSELLLGDLPAGSPLVKNAAEISKAAGRAATLTRQLLAYGRKQFLQPEILDLNRVIAGMENVLQHLMGSDVITQIVPASDLQTVKADAGQIEQVIMNMVMNARDAMPNGGKLTLETANVSFDQDSVGRYPELKPGDYVLLAISDTGTGMSDAVKARVFEPFFSTKGVGQGTGLGLSTGYGIIKQSGGHISVYSELGRGTTFKIYLPQVQAPAKIPVSRLDSPDLPHGTETILLVEDDPALRDMAATLLRRLGYTIFTAGNGVEALSVQHERRTGRVDLLFTDVVMPHMSGKELADRVRALYPATKILFTSAYTENAIVHQGVMDIGVALLQKPFTPSALANKLREVLDAPVAPKSNGAQEKFGLTKISGEKKVENGS